MGRKKQDEGPESPEPQSEEAREKILMQAAGGLGTATGQARANLLGEEQERIDNLESRGSTQPIAGGDQIQSDYPANDTENKPIGAQAQPSAFTSNGSLPVNMVPSPSGLVPASTVAGSLEDASKAVEKANKERDDLILRSGAKKLSRAQIEAMSAADLRAVAHDRGYDIGEYAGSRRTRARFLEAQQKDTFSDGEQSPAPDGEGGEGGEKVE